MDSHPVSGDEAFSGEYRIVAQDEKLSKPFRDDYWASVKQVLREVFHGDETEADATRKRVEDFEELTGQPQNLFYHADPFEVATDLAGRRGQEITPEEAARYQVVLSQERPPDPHVKAMLPEDA